MNFIITDPSKEMITFIGKKVFDPWKGIKQLLFYNCFIVANVGIIAVFTATADSAIFIIVILLIMIVTTFMVFQ